MKKSDKIIEILARLCAVAVILFCLWIKYELSISAGDGMPVAHIGQQSGNLTVEIL